MADTERTITAEAFAELARREGVDYQIDTEDAVPLRLNPVFISLGLKPETFLEQSGGSGANNAAVDLTTVEGQLRAFEALGFHPGPDTVGFNTPPHRRAAAAFSAANPRPPGAHGRMERMNAPITDPVLLEQLQARLREAGVPFRLGSVSPPTERRPQLFLMEYYQL